MDNLIAPKSLKLGIFRCLKSGTNPEFPEQGTPQGGVVSPLLANIALNGIESIHKYHRSESEKVKQKITKNTPEDKIAYASVRYADDMVIFLRPQDNAEEILKQIDEFLASRGMKVSEKKTKITATINGFDFLGWNFKIKPNGKYLCVPAEDNFEKFRKKVKSIVNCSNYGAKEKAKKLSPIVRGWRNYHKYCDMSGSKFSLWFISHKAFAVFNKEKKLDRYTSKELTEKAFPSVSYSLAGHIKVKGNKSPFDGDITYWSERNSKLYDGETAKVLKKQSNTCAACGMKFTCDERVHLHHIDGNHNNWKKNNLAAVHESCHDYIHIGKSAS
ncbi:reverse transcriptase homolog [Calothrix sp. NIES-4071]|nr:reverse transcriptase homolog [Calothrix sp. NIES-4071]BAZ60725.1 reverse transcriptase homolog [Calothrix sp. NIES-4105]